MQRSMLAGQPLAGTSVAYGEGVISTSVYCGHSGTINGFNTDMYYFPKSDTTLIINLNRLDKDNHARTTPFLEAIFRLVTAPAAK
jgi:D-alanyl-D-alanine carboxypeptidase